MSTVSDVDGMRRYEVSVIDDGWKSYTMTILAEDEAWARAFALQGKNDAVHGSREITAVRLIRLRGQ